MLGLLLLFCCLWVPLVQAQSRPPAVAGQFYPGGAAELTAEVDRYLSTANPSKICGSEPRLVGLIAPHAGYMYSGATAGVAFKAIAGQVFDRVYFLGVDHRSRLPSISLWMRGAYDTPLGPVPLDASPSASLLARGGIFADRPEQHLQEHSLEVLLPFYIRAIGFRPASFISVGGQPNNGLELGRELIRELSGFSGRVLVIASTDWSHYHDATQAKQLDDAGLKSVLALDSSGLLRDVEAGKTELCGLNGVLALLTLMKAASASAVLLDQTDSSRASGDTSQVVGYAAVLMTAPALAKPGAGGGVGSAPAGVSPDAGKREESRMDFKQEALQAVRKTLEAVVTGKDRPVIVFAHPRFKEVSGVFVTLKKHGDLRGCIGMIEGRRPLGEGLQEMTVAAALEDTRFSPVKPAELPDIHVDISVLSPMIPVKDLSEIQVGRDGVLLRMGYHSGVFLPQVATEQGWDRDTFLENLCYKAGLPAGAHKDPAARLFRFTAEILEEDPR